MNTIIDVDAVTLARLQIDMLKKLRSGQITPEQLKHFLGLTKKERERLLKTGALQPIIRLISGQEKLVISATDGKEAIHNSPSVFQGHIDRNFYKWSEQSDSSGPKPRTRVAVYELAIHATFEQVFSSFGKIWNTQCLTQSQIIEFVKEYRSWLRKDGHFTFFLFRSRGEFLVACLLLRPDSKLEAHVMPIMNSNVWEAERCHRIVVPHR